MLYMNFYLYMSLYDYILEFIYVLDNIYVLITHMLALCCYMCAHTHHNTIFSL